MSGAVGVLHYPLGRGLRRSRDAAAHTPGGSTGAALAYKREPALARATCARCSPSATRGELVSHGEPGWARAPSPAPRPSCSSTPTRSASASRRLERRLARIRRRRPGAQRPAARVRARPADAARRCACAGCWSARCSSSSSRSPLFALATPAAGSRRRAARPHDERHGGEVRDWWAENPMTYGEVHGDAGVRRGRRRAWARREFFDRVDRRVLRVEPAAARRAAVRPALPLRRVTAGGRCSRSAAAWARWR